MSGKPTAFHLNPGKIRQTGIRTLVLAFRVLMQPRAYIDPGAGGFHNSPKIGTPIAISDRYQLGWFSILKFSAWSAVDGVVLTLLAVIAFSLILVDRSDAVYLWIGACFLSGAIFNLYAVCYYFLPLSSITLSLAAALISNLGLACWVVMWWVWFGRKGGAWLPRAVFGLGLLESTLDILRQLTHFANSQQINLLFGHIDTLISFSTVCLLGWILFGGILRFGIEGWMVLPCASALAITYLMQEISQLHIPMYWSPFGIGVAMYQVLDAFNVAALSLLLLRRLIHSVRRQRVMALDVKQAQEVQSVLLPENISVNGLVIRTEYLPAREVGGDFFQIVPHSSDGSVLIVAGDVTGKGLQAGMLVAVIVGAIRTAADFSTDPAFLLQTLNRRMLGRSEAFATCLALRIEIAGNVTLANAGHLAPYLNGVEVPMEGALPLGMLLKQEFPVSHFHIKKGDTLMLISDGILEAQDKSGELFGFERVSAFLRADASARALSAAAQAFGQNDDISAVSVTWA